MFLIDYPCILSHKNYPLHSLYSYPLLPITRTFYSKKATWNLLHTYIDAHSQSLRDEYKGDGAHAISPM